MRHAFRRLKSLLRRERLDDELQEEIRTHIELRRQQLIADGMDPSEAEAAAQRAFGNVVRIREDTRAMWGFPSLDSMLQDVRYGARMLRRSPMFTAVAVLSLAVGMGAAAAVFSLADAVLIRKLPVKDPDRLFVLEWRNEGRMPFESLTGTWNGTRTSSNSTSFSMATYEALRDRATADAAFIGFASLPVNVGIDGDTESASALVASGNYFDVLGAVPAAGRLLARSDDGDDAPPVVVISHALWQRRFGSAPDAVGRVITVNTIPVSIAGIAARGFRGTMGVGDEPQVIVPLALRGRLERNDRHRSASWWWVLVMARLRPGLEPSRALPSFERIVQQSVAEGNPVLTPADLPRLTLLPGARGLSDRRSDLLEPLQVMSLVVAIVLLVACANVANLLLSRGQARAREVAVRVAIGARRSRVVRQLLTEGLLLAIFGSTLGLLVARWMALSLMPALQGLPATSIDIGPDWRVFAFTAIVGSVCSILFGLVPALRSTDVRLAGTLQEHGRPMTGGRRRPTLAGSLVVLQVALSVLLVTSAALLIHSARNLVTVNPGFDPTNTLLLRVDPTRNGYTRERAASLYSAALEQLAAIPGVRSVSFSSSTLISGGGSSTIAALPDAPALELGSVEARAFASSHFAALLTVDDRFFSTMNIAILRGRSFDGSDTADGPRVAIVNRALAAQLFGHVDVVGRQFKTELRAGAPLYEIVGVCADAKYTSIRRDAPPTFYLTHRQRPLGAMTFALKTVVDPHDVVAAARDVIRQLDSALPVSDVRTQEEQIRRSVQRELLFARLAAALGGVTLALAAIGLYGLLAYAVTRRTQEIGLRMALGAERGTVRWMILRHSLMLVLAGLALGIPGALAGSRVIQSMLFGLTPSDPGAIAAATGVMLAISLAASFIPAQRAASVDPVVALRAE
jgi:predicted permease